MAHAYLFPASYAHWLTDRLQGQATETLATCETCAMVKPEGLTRDPGPFDPKLKCCTYFPFIPNFSLGAILKASHENASTRVRLTSAEQQGVLLPLGLFPTPERQSLIESLGSEAFGQRRELLCPFYDTAVDRCSIWAYRPAVCTSYFCKSNRGQSGLDLWADIEKYLNHFEWQLANEVFARLGFDEDALEMCRAAMFDENQEADERAEFIRAAWGSWFNRKEEFFMAALQTALTFDSDSVGKLFDEDHLDLENSIRRQVAQTR